MKSLFSQNISLLLGGVCFVILVLAILATLAFRPRTSSWEGLLATALNDSVNAYDKVARRGCENISTIWRTPSMSAPSCLTKTWRTFRTTALPNGRCGLQVEGREYRMKAIFSRLLRRCCAIRELPPTDCTATP